MRSEKLIYLLKVVWATLLYYLGILHLFKWWVLRDRAVVLMYHRVLDKREWQQSCSHPGIIVETDTFAMQMDVLQRHFHVISLQQLVERLRQRVPFERNTCVITFDDGWLDNYRNALPVLQRYRLSATIFLPTAYIGTGKMFWREQTISTLQQAVRKRGEASDQLLQSLGLSELRKLSADDAIAAIHDYLNGLKELAPARRESILAEIEACAGRLPDGGGNTDRFIDWQQAREMLRYNIRFGSHGHSHTLFDQLDQSGLTEELRLSRKTIEAELAVQVKTLSYPNGNHDAQIAEIVQSEGYEAAFIAQAGTVAGDDDPFTLRRINVHEAMTWTPGLFLARILGVV